MAGDSKAFHETTKTALKRCAIQETKFGQFGFTRQTDVPSQSWLESAFVHRWTCFPRTLGNQMPDIQFPLSLHLTRPE